MTVTTDKTKLKTLIKHAIKVMRKSGWTQGISRDHQGRVCAVGALDKAREELGYPYKIYDDAVDIVTGVVPKGHHIVDYNDKQGRHQRTIEKLFERAAKSL